ncbi:MAG: putative transcriptional regulator, contains domain [Planctomycetota bacterium]|nr:putative transcriptional regulator, contains domain [Planctomycetota bacterium]
MADEIDSLLRKLERLVREGGEEPIEGDIYELKSVPSDGGSWHQIAVSANAFLNTRGGILILGVKEHSHSKGTGPWKRYSFTGWREDNENNLRDLPKKFADMDDRSLELDDQFRPLVIRPFLDGQIALQFVDELSAESKYVFLRKDGKFVRSGGVGYKRSGTGDVELTRAEVEIQREYRDEALTSREMRPVEGTTLESIDLDKLNDFITRLNNSSGTKLETLKATHEAALSFLERKSFVKDGRVTLLGMLVCGAHVSDRLEYRCQVHGYVDGPDGTILDKQDLADNVFPLIEASNAYVLRNIQVGVGMERGGAAKPQYPDKLIRETVNNALAHRDYSINKQDLIVVKPGESLSMKNPGAFRRHLLIETDDGPRPIRRIIPEAKPRNPKLAHALRAFDKWEGRGIGMSTMVNYCLENLIDLPYYKLGTEEVELVLRPGLLVGDRMERYFRSFGGYLREKLGGIPPNEAQKRVLAYLIKSQWDNERYRYTILLSPDNNHSEELRRLSLAGLIRELQCEALSPVFVVDATLTEVDHTPSLRQVFGRGFDDLGEDARKSLAVVYRHNQYGENRDRYPSAKDVSFALWYEQERSSHDDIRKFDAFYRQVRKLFEKLRKDGFVENRGSDKFPKYELNERYLESHFSY